MWSGPLLLQKEAPTAEAQHCLTRGVRDSLCQVDASQSEEASVKPTQVLPSPSDTPALTNTPPHRPSEAAAMPVGPESGLPCSLSATGCGGITAWSLSCQEGDLGGDDWMNTKRNLDFKIRQYKVLETEPPTECSGGLLYLGSMLGSPVGRIRKNTHT